MQTAPERRVRSPIIVLGMHRSGTSCLAGSLEEAGLHLGEVNVRAPHNARGNRENRAIMDLHESILAANGGSWDAPPPQVIWSAEHLARRDAIIATYPSELTWGFKDPRSLLLLDGWIAALPELRFVGTFRHPAAVAASLAKRNGFEVARSYAIWAAYNRRLLEYRLRHSFPLLSFDWTHARYLSALEGVATAYGLQVPKDGFRFFATELRSNAASAEVMLPREIGDLYARLLSLAA